MYVRLLMIDIDLLLYMHAILLTAPPLSHDCPSLPPFYQVFCGNPANARECVLELWLCDGKSDCSNGLDESAETCNGGKWKRIECKQKAQEKNCF